MPNLFAALNTASQTLRTFDRALTTTQNNVQNAQTPGFAKQRQNFQARPFEPANGILGGVSPGALVNSRDRFAEAGVLRQVESLGYHSARTTGLTAIESVLDFRAEGSIPGALQNLFNRFSAWSVAPNSPADRKSVLEAARNVASAFRQTAEQLASEARSADRQAGNLVQRINELAAKVRDYNVERRRLPAPDPNLEANVTSTLEELSALIDVTPLYQEDGTVSLLAGGQSALVVGEQLFELSIEIAHSSGATYPDGLPAAWLRDGQGAAINGIVGGGALGGVLNVRNQVIPGLIGGSSEQGSLNRLAKAFADRVNSLLAAGQTAGGQPGAALFSYDIARPANVARTLVVPDLSPDQLAAVQVGPPPVANGVALELARLQSPEDDASKIDGQSYSAFFSQVSASVGRDLGSARDSVARQEVLTAQARALRASISGVSLDEEAVQLIALQRSYEASARMVRVVDELTQTLLGMLR
ncbi:MAG: flagellar hook-associated protein FlgK [Bryobacterales bacterium]|nr:flagellar hook-associated protein FlgK [Bryobacterales bacterium]